MHACICKSGDECLHACMQVCSKPSQYSSRFSWYMCVWVYMFICMYYVYMYLLMYVRTYVCMYIIYIYIYIYIHVICSLRQAHLHALSTKKSALTFEQMLDIQAPVPLQYFPGSHCKTRWVASPRVRESLQEKKTSTRKASLTIRHVCLVCSRYRKGVLRKSAALFLAFSRCALLMCASMCKSNLSPNSTQSCQRLSCTFQLDTGMRKTH